MKMKSFSQIVEEIKCMPQEDIDNFSSGEEFEHWLKSKKQHYKDNCGNSITMTTKAHKFNSISYSIVESTHYNTVFKVNGNVPKNSYVNLKRGMSFSFSKDLIA